MKGVVTRVFWEKAYGFIVNDDGTDCFFHAQALLGVKIEEFQEGDAVEYEAVQGPKGWRAQWVKKR